MTLNEILNVYSKVTGNNYIGVAKIERLMGAYKRVTIDVYNDNSKESVITKIKTEKIKDEDLSEFKKKLELEALEDLFKLTILPCGVSG